MLFGPLAARLLPVNDLRYVAEDPARDADGRRPQPEEPLDGSLIGDGHGLAAVSALRSLRHGKRIAPRRKPIAAWTTARYPGALTLYLSSSLRRRCSSTRTLHPTSKDRSGTLVRLADPCRIDAQCCRAAARVAEAPRNGA